MNGPSVPDGDEQRKSRVECFDGARRRWPQPFPDWQIEERPVENLLRFPPAVPGPPAVQTTGTTTVVRVRLCMPRSQLLQRFLGYRPVDALHRQVPTNTIVAVVFAARIVNVIDNQILATVSIDIRYGGPTPLVVPAKPARDGTDL